MYMQNKELQKKKRKKRGRNTLWKHIAQAELEYPFYKLNFNRSSSLIFLKGYNYFTYIPWVEPNQ